MRTPTHDEIMTESSRRVRMAWNDLRARDAEDQDRQAMFEEALYVAVRDLLSE